MRLIQAKAVLHSRPPGFLYMGSWLCLSQNEVFKGTQGSVCFLGSRAEVHDGNYGPSRFHTGEVPPTPPNLITTNVRIN